MQSPSRFESASRAAVRRALTLGAVSAVVVGVVLAVAVSLVVGVVALVVLAAAWVAAVQSAVGSCRARVASSVGGTAVGDDQPRLHSALSSVAVMTGAPVPEVSVLDTDAANAMVAADEQATTVVVTRGLLEEVGWVQLEALAAELLCRVRDGSAAYATLAAGLPAPIAAAAGLRGSSVAAVLGDQRAIRADLDVVEVTRYPPALISTLEAMRARGTEVSAAPPGTAPLWVAPAVGVDRGVDEAVDATANQSLDYRIAALEEL